MATVLSVEANAANRHSDARLESSISVYFEIERASAIPNALPRGANSKLGRALRGRANL